MSSELNLDYLYIETKIQTEESNLEATKFLVDILVDDENYNPIKIGEMSLLYLNARRYTPLEVLGLADMDSQAAVDALFPFEVYHDLEDYYDKNDEDPGMYDVYGRIGVLTHLKVFREYHKKGIGKRAFRLLEYQLYDLGVEFITVYAEPHNSVEDNISKEGLHKFYEKLGFKLDVEDSIGVYQVE